MLIVDSHTEGEPTRVILEGGPDLGSGPLSDRARRLATEFKDFYRSTVLEPYGQEAMVGALLVEPTDPECITGVIYFDAAAVIGMCGHGNDRRRGHTGAHWKNPCRYLQNRNASGYCGDHSHRQKHRYHEKHRQLSL